MGSVGLPTLEELADRYYAPDDFTRKGPAYLASYERLLAGRRDADLAVLELGISSGASLLCWRDYLPNATIIGIDIAQAPARVVGQERIHVLRGSQDDPRILDQAAQIVGGRIDLIIDDASHVGYLTKRSLHYLFPRWLAPGGCYVIEDFGTGFLPDYPDGVAFAAPEWADAVPGAREFRGSQFGMVGVVKQLVDNLMQELMTGARSYLSIERLIIESNVAFIEKSRMPGGPWPGHIADVPLVQAVSAPSAPADPGADLRGAISDHAARISELERVVGLVRRGLAPVLWLRRSFRR
jgi:hypothetical protein